MSLNISDEILSQTTKCQFNLICLENGNYPLCQVENDVGSVIFVKQSGTNCSFAMPFGLGHVCHCPSRREIFKKYSK